MVGAWKDWTRVALMEEQTREEASEEPGGGGWLGDTGYPRFHQFNAAEMCLREPKS